MPRWTHAVILVLAMIASAQTAIAKVVEVDRRIVGVSEQRH